MWFDSWSDIINVVISAIVGFSALVLFLRLAGKRTLSKMNAFDFIITFSLGTILATTILSADVSISEGLAALLAVIGLQYIVTFLEVRSDLFQRIIKSKPTLLFENGAFQYDKMKIERISKVEVLAAMRYKGFADRGAVRFVLLETDGRLSVIPYKDSQQDLGALAPVTSLSTNQKTED